MLACRTGCLLRFSAAVLAWLTGFLERSSAAVLAWLTRQAITLINPAIACQGERTSRLGKQNTPPSGQLSEPLSFCPRSPSPVGREPRVCSLGIRRFLSRLSLACVGHSCLSLDTGVGLWRSVFGRWWRLYWKLFGYLCRSVTLACCSTSNGRGLGCNWDGQSGIGL